MKLCGRGGNLSSCWKLAFGLSFIFSFPPSQAAIPSLQYVNLTLYWGKWSMSEIYYPDSFEESPLLATLAGVLVVPEGEPKDACNPKTMFNIPPDTETWIAFISRGGCNIIEKVNVAAERGAAGIIIYDPLSRGGKEILILTCQESGDTVAFTMSSLKGMQIIRLIQRGVRVVATTEIRNMQCFWKIHLCAYSLILTFIAYILLGYTPGQVRPRCEEIKFDPTKADLKKAIRSLELRKLTKDAEELNGDVCVVCLETYKPKEILRVLMCKHVFHKNCIDCWLVNHGACPICNASILKGAE